MSPGIVNTGNQVLGMSPGITNTGNQALGMSPGITNTGNQALGMSPGITNTGNQALGMSPGIANTGNQVLGMSPGMPGNNVQNNGIPNQNQFPNQGIQTNCGQNVNGQGQVFNPQNNQRQALLVNNPDGQVKYRPVAC